MHRLVAWRTGALRNSQAAASACQLVLLLLCRLNGSLSRSASRGNMTGAGSQHGSKGALAKSKSVRKGLARGSLALLDRNEVVGPEDSQVGCRSSCLLAGNAVRSS